MNGNLLDTNVIIGILRNDNKMIAFIENLDNLYIPSVVIGELYYGANLSSKKEANKRIIEKLTNGIEILSIDHSVSLVYADIKCTLKKKGFNIPENDLWIAAIAQKNNMIVVTNDRHFNNIETIKVVNPSSL